MGTRGRLGSRSLRQALPDKDGLAVLSWDIASPVDLDAASVREVLSAAQRGNDLVVLDLPRALDDVTVEVVTRCDRVLVTVAPTVVGVASAAKVLSRLRAATDRIGLVLRRGGAPSPPSRSAATLGAPLVAELAAPASAAGAPRPRARTGARSAVGPRPGGQVRRCGQVLGAERGEGAA